MKYKVGEIIFKEGKVAINEEKSHVEIVVTNLGDRSIQVCAHYHFFEANTALKFEREKTLGMRLDVPSGTAVRFEPGEEKRVVLVPYGGERKIIGFMGAVMGRVDDPAVRAKALKNMEEILKGE